MLKMILKIRTHVSRFAEEDQSRQSKQLSFWSNFQSKPVEHPKALAAKSSSCQKEKQSVTEPVEGM